MRLWPVQVIMRVELLYGLAGLVGSLVSGHLYLLLGASLGNGTLLLTGSIVLHALSLIQAGVLLKVSEGHLSTRGDGSCLSPRVLSVVIYPIDEVRVHSVSSTGDFRRTQFPPEMCLFLSGENGSDRRAGGGAQPPLPLQPRCFRRGSCQDK